MSDGTFEVSIEVTKAEAGTTIPRVEVEARIRQNFVEQGRVVGEIDFSDFGTYITFEEGDLFVLSFIELIIPPEGLYVPLRTDRARRGGGG